MRKLVWCFAGLGLLTGAGLLVAPLLLKSSCTGNAGNARATLRTLLAAQREFRETDADGDGLRSYWRGDVAGLYGRRPKGTGEPLRFIEISAASADLFPLEGVGERVPKAGYWYAALPFEDEEDRPKDPDRFAFGAAPDSLAAGRHVYIVAQDGVLWEAPPRLGRDVPRAYPFDPEKAGWRRTSP